MSSFGSWTDSIVNQLRAHSYIWINPKTTNLIESKLLHMVTHNRLEHEQEGVIKKLIQTTLSPIFSVWYTKYVRIH